MAANSCKCPSSSANPVISLPKSCANPFWLHERGESVAQTGAQDECSSRTEIGAQAWIVDIANGRVLVYREPCEAGSRQSLELGAPPALEICALQGVCIDFSWLAD